MVGLNETASVSCMALASSMACSMFNHIAPEGTYTYTAERLRGLSPATMKLRTYPLCPPIYKNVHDRHVSPMTESGRKLKVDGNSGSNLPLSVTYL